MLYIASEVMVSDTHAPSLILIHTAINQLETKVSLKTICCLRLFVVVHKHVLSWIRGNGGRCMYTNSRCHQHNR